jgi:hypothetical protein
LAQFLTGFLAGELTVGVVIAAGNLSLMTLLGLLLLVLDGVFLGWDEGQELLTQREPKRHCACMPLCCMTLVASMTLLLSFECLSSCLIFCRLLGALLLVAVAGNGESA